MGTGAECPGERELPVWPVWLEEPVTLGEEGARFVMVEAEALPGEVQGAFTLKLWDRGGTRTVTLEGVMFPLLRCPRAPVIDGHVMAPL
jgi:hypothetical protein